MWKFPGPPPGRPARVPQGPRRAGRPPIAGKFPAISAALPALHYGRGNFLKSCQYIRKRVRANGISFTLCS